MLLTNIAYNKTGERELAEELVQETFINLYQHKMSLDTNTSIRAYLYVVLKNKITDQYRQKKIHQRYQEYVTNHSQTEVASPLLWVETRELETILKDAINNLPPQCQRVYKLSREQFLTDKEIAAELSISIKTVERHKSKALRLLRNALDHLFEAVVVAYLLGK